MSDIVSEGKYSRKFEVATALDSKNRVYISISDLVLTALDVMSTEERKDFFLNLLSWDEASTAFVECLNGYGHGESGDSVNRLRKLCTFGASDAVKVLVSNVMEAADKDKQRLEDCKEYIETLRKAWPTGFEKYFPKHDHFFPKWNDKAAEADKLIEEAVK